MSWQIVDADRNHSMKSLSAFIQRISRPIARVDYKLSFYTERLPLSTAADVQLKKPYLPPLAVKIVCSEPKDQPTINLFN